uniref:Uncharacterized protein LOC100185492 n=1 Tax=Phallusia mammillata TaxID=59560 RepID=A0A6F9DHP8_9ASCI|nr:uncharacterized protein LOC100185492 [Phallusia mammillata]
MEKFHGSGIMLKEQAWPLQRLVSMLQSTLNKDKEEWKGVPLSSPASMKDVSPEDRDEVVIWIAELNNQFNFHPETFFLAVSILDRFITAVKAQPKYLKCIAITCFYLASKITEEEDVIPCTGELVEDSNCGCRICDVLRMERIILEKLSWDINATTPLHYLHIFQVIAFSHFTDLSSVISITHRLAALTNDLTHAMCHYKLARFPNAAIALALLSLELESIIVDASKWTSITGQLQAIAKIQTSDFMQCRETLNNLLSDTLFEKVYTKVNSEDIPLHTSQIPCQKASKSKAAFASPNSTWAKQQFRDNSEPDTIIDGENMEVGESPLCYDSDKTLTASEGEETDDESAPLADFESHDRPLTYAEIVKWGMPSYCSGEMQNQDCNKPLQATVPTLSKRCHLQASSFPGQPQRFLAMSEQLAPSMQG